jgi:16S rRNA G966 N2-methylase RsmD
VFVDHGETACSIVAENVEALGLRSRAFVAREDVYRFLRSEGTTWPLVLADPPYGTGHPGRLLALVGERRSLAPGGRLVLEHEVREDPGEAVGGLRRLKHRVAGGTALSIYVWGDR